MGEIEQLRRDVDDLRRRLDQMVRFGKVSAGAPSAATARVVFDDDASDDAEVVSHDMPVLQQRTKGDRDYHSLTSGEQVVCLFGGEDGVQGVVLGCHYSEAQAPPVADGAARVIGGDDIRLGSESASDAVALEPTVKSAMQVLKDAINSAATAPNDGGSTLKTNIIAALSAWPPSDMGAGKVKAE